jgi:hypothetical protein
MLHYAIPRAGAEGGVYDSYWSATHTYVPVARRPRLRAAEHPGHHRTKRKLKDDAFRP